MSFKDVIGHKKPIELLQRAIINDRVYHSYIFLGNEGIGRRYAALQFAKALNCLERKDDEADSCDQCLSCKKIDDALHPDVSFLEPEGPSRLIKKEAIIQLQRELAFRPFEGKNRVCILTTADRMAPEISNTLLKTLEEPPPRTVIILLANSAGSMLPTILSRCQQIHFNPVPLSPLSKWLEEKRGLNREEAHLLAALSEGSLGKALALREEIPQIPRKEILKGWLEKKTFSFGEIERWVESLPTDWENLVLILEVVKTLLRDLVVSKVLGNGAKLIHSDLAHEIEALSSGRSISSLLNQLESIHQTRHTLNPNPRIVNITLALEAMMLSWAEG